MLYGVLHSHVRLGDRRCERVEVDAYQVYVADTVLRQLSAMALQVAAAQQGSVHFRVQGLDASVANLRESGYLADSNGLYSIAFQQFLSSSGCDDFPTEFHKSGGEFDYAVLVAYTE